MGTGAGVEEQRRAYRASWRRPRRQRSRDGISSDEDDGPADGDEDDEVDETLREKMGRLRKETMEVADEVERRKRRKAVEQEQLADEAEAEVTEEEEVLQLCKMMEQTRKSYEGLEPSAWREMDKLLKQVTALDERQKRQQQKTPAAAAPPEQPSNTTTASTPSPALLKAAEFETRLALLESVLGLSTTAGSATAATPILPSLSALEAQLALLTTDPPSSSSDLSRRIQALASSTTQHTKPTTTEPTSPTTNTTPPATIDPQTQQQLTQLYAALPTIETLAPSLPPLLTRLQTLRHIHSDAASTHASVQRLEEKSDEVDREIKLWREGLEKVEERARGWELVWKGNAEGLETGVRGVERRVEALGGGGARIVGA